MDTKGKRFLYLAVTAVNLMTIVGTTGYSWTSPYLPKLNGNVDPDSNPLSRPTTILEDSWITSLQNLGSIFSPIVTSLMADKLGKKKTLILFSIPLLISNIIFIFANSVVHIYVSRFLLGIGAGCVFSVIPTYVAEISNVENRGSTSMILNIMTTFVALFVVVIGPYVSMADFATMCLVPCVLFLLIFGIFIPESPYHFVMRNDLDEAERSLAKLRQNEDVKKELFDIIATVEATKTTVSFKEIIQSKVVIRSLLITVGLVFFQQLTGCVALVAYQQTIFDMTGSSLPGYIAVMIITAIQVVPTLLTAYVVDKAGRRILLIISFGGMFVSLVLLGAFFFLQSRMFNLNGVFWLPMTCVLAFMTFFKCGAGPLPWTIVGEVFPNNLKAQLSAIVTISNFIFGFLISFVFPTMFVRLGMAWTIWIFAAFTGTAIIFVITVLPETKGKSFSEIQDMLRGSASKK